MRRLIYLTLLILGAASPLYAAEGFFNTPLKAPGLAKAWNGTVAVMEYSADLGRDRISTGFVAKQQAVQSKYYLFIVVSRRTLEANNETSGGLKGIRFYGDIK